MKVTVMLILINTLVFFYTFLTDPAYWINNYGFSPKRFNGGNYYIILTSFFLHASLRHLAGNMIALFLLGVPLEKKLGKIKMLFAYFLGGIVGNLSMLLPMFAKPTTVGVGASAAISGLVGLGTFAAPGKLVLFPSFIPFPFIVAGAIYLLVTVANLFEISHIAYHAHLFGFLAGSLVGILFTKNRVKKILAFFLILLLINTLPLIVGYFF